MTQYNTQEKNGNIIERWSSCNVIESPVAEPTPDNLTGEYLQIHTLEGTMTAGVGDYIIRGVKGEYYPCKADIFEQTHIKVEEDSSDFTNKMVPNPTHSTKPDYENSEDKYSVEEIRDFIYFHYAEFSEIFRPLDTSVTWYLSDDSGKTNYAAEIGYYNVQTNRGYVYYPKNSSNPPEKPKRVKVKKHIVGEHHVDLPAKALSGYGGKRL